MNAGCARQTPLVRVRLRTVLQKTMSRPMDARASEKLVYARRQTSSYLMACQSRSTRTLSRQAPSAIGPGSRQWCAIGSNANGGGERAPSGCRACPRRSTKAERLTACDDAIALLLEIADLQTDDDGDVIIGADETGHNDLLARINAFLSDHAE